MRVASVTQQTESSGGERNAQNESSPRTQDYTCACSVWKESHGGMAADLSACVTDRVTSAVPAAVIIVITEVGSRRSTISGTVVPARDERSVWVTARTKADGA